MKRAIAVAVFAFSLGTAAVNAQVYVRIGPPPVVVERPSRRPGPRYVWVAGYYRWNGRRYVWVPGRWVKPPRRSYTTWIPGRWVQGPRGWVWVQGRWR